MPALRASPRERDRDRDREREGQRQRPGKTKKKKKGVDELIQHCLPLVAASTEIQGVKEEPDAKKERERQKERGPGGTEVGERQRRCKDEKAGWREDNYSSEPFPLTEREVIYRVYTEYTKYTSI